MGAVEVVVKEGSPVGLVVVVVRPEAGVEFAQERQVGDVAVVETVVDVGVVDPEYIA